MTPAQILVVEDDGIIAHHLQQVLRRLGYSVPRLASSGPEAVACAAQNDPDIILMDIVLDGEMDGIQTAEHIRELKNIPIIFLTAYSDDAVLQRARVTDPFGYVLKPFEERNLHATIEMALQRHRLEMRLRETQERYLAVVEQATEGILLIDPDNMSIIETNPACLRMMNLEKIETIGQPVWKVFGADQQLFSLQFANLVHTGFMRHRDLVVKRPNQNDLFLEIVLNTIHYSNQSLVCAVIRDVTARKQAEIEKQNQLERLVSLRTIELSMSHQRDLRSILTAIMDQITCHLQVDAASVLLLDRQKFLHLAANRGFHHLDIEHVAIQLGESYAGKAAAERRMIFANNLDDPEVCRNNIPNLINENFVTYCGIPLLVNNEVTGVLEIMHRTRLTPEPEWFEYLNILAGQAAIAIDNISLFQEQQAANQKLAIAYEATIEGWSRALELRDRETEGHSLRVTEMAVKLAKELNLPDSELDQVRLGALLHDIGKMGIPDSILLKPGPLTAEEWEKMRQHPVYAYELLAPVGFLQPALEIAYAHHERWDGTGYPRRLKGEEIPLKARIFAVIDVWDSLSNDRPYRRRWSTDEVYEYIRSNAGKQFDPHIVDIFLQMEIWKESQV